MKVTKNIVQHAAAFNAGELAIILDSIANMEPVGDNYLRQLMSLEVKLCVAQAMLNGLLSASERALGENPNLLDEVA